MGLEIATYISDLNPANPATSDPLAQGDDHIRLMKAALKASFPLVIGQLNATMVPFTPVSGLVATTVAGALAELQSSRYEVGEALGTPASGNLANCTFPTLNQNTTGTAANATNIADGAVSSAAKIADNIITPAKLTQKLTLGSVATASGVAVDFTGIPSWAKRITVALNGISITPGSELLIQMGVTTPETTGYASGCDNTGGTGVLASTAGFLLTRSNSAAALNYGNVTLCLQTGNTWVSSASIYSSGIRGMVSGGAKTFGGAINMLRLTTTTGTDTFDAGSVNILFEG